MESMTEHAPADVRTSDGRRLYRSRDSILGGVGGGLGEYFGVDPVWFRIGFVLLALGGGSGVLIYLIMWLVVPQRPDGAEAPQTPHGSLTGAAILGIVLIAVGTISLVNTIAPSMGRFFWPVAFIGAGVALALGGFRNDSDR